jgi:hypothetical protein
MGAPTPVQEPPEGPANLASGLPRQNDPTVPAPWGRIVRRLYSLDVDKAWSEVIAAEEQHRLRPPSKREYHELIDDLAEAAHLHELLIQLVPNADLVFARYEADIEALQGDMRAQAREALEDEKQKKGGKQITDSDVRSRMASAFPDAYARQAEMLEKAKGTRDLMERVRDSWGARRRELETIIRTTRAQ